KEKSAPDLDAYRYHYENFVLRVIGLDDRAHRFVGSALALDRAEVESIKGNQIVRRHTKTHFPAVQSALLGVSEAVKDYRKTRNELIHNAAFSSREIGLLLSVRHFALDIGNIDVSGLAWEYISDGRREIDATRERLAEVLASLLDTLAPIFSDAVLID